MGSVKYNGMDVHKETISLAVMNNAGKLLMESIIETRASTILQFVAGLRGDLRVTFEEGTWAAWLYDLLQAHVTEIVVCNPRKNGLLNDGNISDRIDARKLADLLRGNYLKPVYHGEHGLRMLKELSRTYLTVSKDLVRVMNRLKALYRSWGIAYSGKSVYIPSQHEVWLNKIKEAGVRRRAEYFYQQLDTLLPLRKEVRRELLSESRKQSASEILRDIPTIGSIRSGHLVALIQTPHRFRSKKQLWAYSGLALETHDEGRNRMNSQQAGINANCKHDD
jgi:transposase